MLDLNSQLFTAALLVVGGYRVLHPEIHMQVGNLIQFFFLANMFFGSVQPIGQQYNQALTAMAGAERVFDMLDTRPDWEEPPTAIDLPGAARGSDRIVGRECPDKRRGFAPSPVDSSNGAARYSDRSRESFSDLDDRPSRPTISPTNPPQHLPASPAQFASTRNGARVEFRHVTFNYGTDRPALEEVSFVAEPGQTVALVGHTGSGKSSTINLITKFYLPTEGSVLIDGCDTRDIKGDSLHRQMGIVSQQNFLFTGTVMDNIRVGRPSATDEEVVAAVRQTRLPRPDRRVAVGILDPGRRTRR